MVRQLIAGLVTIGVAAPAAVVGVLSLVGVVSSVAGANPDWAAQSVNLTEAAALRDQATVAQRIARGEDAHARHLVRPDLVLNEPATMTPFEAAIAVDRPEIAQLLLWSGYRIDAAEWRQLRCLAQLEKHDDLGALLDTVKPEGAALDCSGVVKPWTR
jgi:hypothetical protein